MKQVLFRAFLCRENRQSPELLFLCIDRALSYSLKREGTDTVSLRQGPGSKQTKPGYCKTALWPRHGQHIFKSEQLVIIADSPRLSPLTAPHGQTA